MEKRGHHITRKTFQRLLVGITALACMLPLLGSGTFQTREAQILVLQDELSPGSPISVILVIPTPQPPQYKAGDMLPLQALLSSSEKRPIQKAPFFYTDQIQLAGQDYILAMAILVVPNTYEEKNIYLDVQFEKAASIASSFFAGLNLPQTHNFPVSPRSFNSETIALGPENTDIKTKPDPQKNKEAAELWKLLTSTDAGLFNTAGFTAPVDSPRRTSYFGDRRVYQYTDGSSERSIHGGIDFGVPRGTPVRASAPGLVRMARFRIVTGNTVIIQHAPGLYSLYYHMDSLSVTEGDLVQTGTELGKSGSTGLSTGPHLHWEFRIQGEFADPDLMVQTAPLDKERIISKITEKLGKTDRSTEGR